MAFPTTSVLDVFTGTNGDDLPVYNSTNWAAISGISNMEIQSNQATGTTTGACSNSWKPTTFGPDCEAYVTIGTKPGNGVGVGCLFRFNTSTLNGYSVVLVPAAGTDAIKVQRITGGAVAATPINVAQELTAGDSIGVQIIGSGANNITLYYKSGAGAWTSIGTGSDSTYTVAGSICIYAEDTVVRMDSFGGGTYVASSTGGPLVNGILVHGLLAHGLAG